MINTLHLRWIYYRLAEQFDQPCASEALAMAVQCLGNDAVIRQDAKALKTIRVTTREKLCRHYKSC